MRVRLTSKVYSDLESAMEYYAREASDEIAGEFYDEFLRCCKVLSRWANSYPLIRENIRRIDFHRSFSHPLSDRQRPYRQPNGCET
jgi:plasmid stabilization system protein ParE